MGKTIDVIELIKFNLQLNVEHMEEIYTEVNCLKLINNSGVQEKIKELESAMVIVKNDTDALESLLLLEDINIVKSFYYNNYVKSYEKSIQLSNALILEKAKQIHS